MLDWTKSVSTDKVAKKYGHAYVHALLASVYWSEKRYELARYHFSLANRAIVIFFVFKVLQYLQNICHFTGLREFSHRISIIERIRW
jgi:hypothetical protein